MNTIQRCSLSILFISLGSSGYQPTPDMDSPGNPQQAQLDVGDPITLPLPDEAGLFSGEYLLSLPGGKLILACGEISLRSQDSGASWQTGPGLLYAKAVAGGTEPSGRLLRLADESFIALAGRAQKGAKPGLFSGRWARFASLEELTSAGEDSWQETSLKVERWKALTADDDTEVAELQVTGPMLELADGTLLAATYGNFQGDTVPMVGFVANKGQKWFKYRTYLLESRDGGESWHRGIHLTGPIRACSSPGAVRWRAIQARRVPARLGRRGRHRPGPLGGDKVLVAHRLVGSGEFEHPVEDHPAAPGASAVEAEHELIQVAAQVGGLHRSLVGAQQPPLGQ